MPSHTRPEQKKVKKGVQKPKKKQKKSGRRVRK